MKMTYEQMCELAKKQKTHKVYDDEEHRIQSSCVRWFRIQYPKMRHNLFAVPNGSFKSKMAAGKFKAEGLLPGVADLILLKSTKSYGALLIEMKTKKGKQSPEQKSWERNITQDGYKYVVCRSVDEFIKEVNNYLAEI